MYLNVLKPYRIKINWIKKFNNTFENFVLGQLKWVSDGGLSEDNHRKGIFPRGKSYLFIYVKVAEDS